MCLRSLYLPSDREGGSWEADRCGGYYVEFRLMGGIHKGQACLSVYMPLIV